MQVRWIENPTYNFFFFFWEATYNLLLLLFIFLEKILLTKFRKEK